MATNYNFNIAKKKPQWAIPYQVIENPLYYGDEWYIVDHLANIIPARKMPKVDIYQDSKGIWHVTFQQLLRVRTDCSYCPSEIFGEGDSGLFYYWKVESLPLDIQKQLDPNHYLPVSTG